MYKSKYAQKHKDKTLINIFRQFISRKSRFFTNDMLTLTNGLVALCFVHLFQAVWNWLKFFNVFIYSTCCATFCLWNWSSPFRYQQPGRNKIFILCLYQLFWPVGMNGWLSKTSILQSQSETAAEFITCCCSCRPASGRGTALCFAAGRNVKFKKKH